jgi:hypothetical protein
MKVLVAPQKVGTGMPKALASIAHMRPRAAGLTEMDLGKTSKVGQLRKVLGDAYRVLAKDLGQHSQEIPVALRVGLFCRLLSYELLPLSPNVGAAGTGNDRWLAVVRFRLFAWVYVLFHTHVNAVIQNHDPKSPHFGEILDNDRVDATAKAMQIIEEQAAAALADPKVGGRVLVTGDLNYLPVMRSLEWEHSPQAMFRRLDMEWTNSRVIYLAWGPGLHLSTVNMIPAHSPDNPADHGWILGRLRRVWFPGKRHR